MIQTGNIPLGWRKIILCLLLVSGSFSPGMTYAIEYYVAKTGNDGNSGAYSSPFLTIQKGMTTMRTGDTLLIRSGTYAEQIDSQFFTIPTGTSWENAPIIAAFPGDVVTIKPNGGSQAIGLVHSYIQYVIFDGLIIDAINEDTANGMGISMTNGANHVRFRNLEVKNAPLNNVLLAKGTGGTEYNEFIGGKYHNSDVWQSSALVKGAYNFYITTDHNLIDGAEIYNATGYGVHIYNSSSTGHAPDYNIVRNCRVYNNNLRRISFAGILLASGIGNMAYNNLVYDNRGHGIQVGNGSIGALVYNNTIFDNDQNGLQIGAAADATNTIIKNNISYGNLLNYYNRGIGTIESNNIIDGTNPLFVDPTNRDFHLQHGSPAIDTGLALAEITVDFEGTARPQGAGYNIGALEGTQPTLGAPKKLRLLSAQ